MFLGGSYGRASTHLFDSAYYESSREVIEPYKSKFQPKRVLIKLNLHVILFSMFFPTYFCTLVNG